MRILSVNDRPSAGNASRKTSEPGDRRHRWRRLRSDDSRFYLLLAPCDRQRGSAAHPYARAGRRLAAVRIRIGSRQSAVRKTDHGERYWAKAGRDGAGGLTAPDLA